MENKINHKILNMYYNTCDYESLTNALHCINCKEMLSLISYWKKEKQTPVENILIVLGSFI